MYENIVVYISNPQGGFKRKTNENFSVNDFNIMSNDHSIIFFFEFLKYLKIHGGLSNNYNTVYTIQLCIDEF